MKRLRPSGTRKGRLGVSVEPSQASETLGAIVSKEVKGR